MKDLVLLDVAPLSIGTEDENGIFDKIIDRNSVLPASGSSDYTTVDDYQTEITFPVYEGESFDAALMV